MKTLFYIVIVFFHVGFKHRGTFVTFVTGPIARNSVIVGCGEGGTNNSRRGTILVPIMVAEVPQRYSNAPIVIA